MTEKFGTICSLLIIVIRQCVILFQNSQVSELYDLVCGVNLFISLADKFKSTTLTAEGGKKRKKDQFELEYQLTPEMRASVDKHFELTKRMTKLSQNTVKMWSVNNTTLPVDLHFDPSDFAK